jgi:hypothetical protein
MIETIEIAGAMIAPPPMQPTHAYLIVEIESLQLKVEQVGQRAELDALGRI